MVNIFEPVDENRPDPLGRVGPVIRVRRQYAAVYNVCPFKNDVWGSFWTNKVTLELACYLSMFFLSFFLLPRWRRMERPLCQIRNAWMSCRMSSKFTSHQMIVHLCLLVAIWLWVGSEPEPGGVLVSFNVLNKAPVPAQAMVGLHVSELYFWVQNRLWLAQISLWPVALRPLTLQFP